MDNLKSISTSAVARKIKVLHVIDELSIGGAEKMLVIIVNGLIERGNEVGVVTLINPGVLAESINPKVTLCSLNRSSRFDWAALQKLNRLARTYDIVHVHLKHTLKFVFLSWLLNPYKSKILLHDHSGEVLVTNKNVYPFVMKWWIKSIYYLGVSQALTKWATAQYNIKPEKSFSLPNVISVVSFPAVVDKQESNWEGIRLVLVSNFRAIKNLEFSINLVNFLKNQRSLKVRLTIYGLPVERKTYESVVNLIDSLNLGDLVTLDSTKHNVIPLLHQYDMAIHCSFAETGPLCLLEYMSIGLPFLTINRGHVPKEIQGYFDEMVIDSFSYEHWADRIQIILDQKQKYRQNLTHFFTQNYSVDTYFNKLNFVYSKIV